MTMEHADDDWGTELSRRDYIKGLSAAGVAAAAGLSATSVSADTPTDTPSGDFSKSVSVISGSDGEANDLRFAFESSVGSPFVDIKIVVDGGNQINLRMTDEGDGLHTYETTAAPPALGDFSDGDEIEYWFVYGLESGGQKESDRFTYTFSADGGSDTPTDTPTPPADTEPPTVPANLSSPSRTTTSVSLDWDDATDVDSGVAQYKVYVDGESTASVRVDASEATVAELSPGTEYTFRVSAVDAQDNESALSEPLTAATEPEGPTLSLAFPDGNRIGANGTVDAAVTLSNAPEGLAGFDVVVEVADASVATIEDAAVEDGFTPAASSVRDDGTTAVLEASDNGKVAEPGATDVTLGTVTLAAAAAGETEVALAIDQIDDDAGDAMSPTVRAGTLSVSSLDPIGDSLPTDPDGDGKYEDLNGNDRLDADDVVLFFQERESDAIQDNVAQYDFNDNGRIDFDDINTLFDEL